MRRCSWVGVAGVVCHAAVGCLPESDCTLKATCPPDSSDALGVEVGDAPSSSSMVSSRDSGGGRTFEPARALRVPRGVIDTSPPAMAVPGLMTVRAQEDASAPDALADASQRTRAACLDGGRSDGCTCEAGFIASSCESSTRDCGANPCVNRDDCVPNPCRNGGLCSVNEDGSGYACSCGTAFTGATCELSRFHGLGFLPGATLSTATGVSADGAVVAGWVSRNESSIAFRWDRSGMKALASNGCSDASGVSADGTTIVGQYTATCGFTAVPVKWVGNRLVPLDRMPGTLGGYATAATTDGAIVVGTVLNADGSSSAVRWVNGAPERLLPSSEAISTSAVGVNADGSIVVGNISAALAQSGFRWEGAHATYELLTVPGYEWSQVRAVSPNGAIIVGLAAPEAVQWRGTAAALLGFTGAASGASDDVIVGERYDAARGDVDPYVWKGSAQSLSTLVDTTGWSYLAPTAISRDGRTVVGNGVHDGHTEAFIARLP